MATFNVFVEGPVDPSADGLTKLADAMAQRYGLNAADLIARLKRGRFRVKSNIDPSTAETYRRDLEKLGARVLIEDSTLSPTATPPVGVPATGPAIPRAGATVMGAGLERKAPASVAPVRTPTPPAGATVMGAGLERKTPASGAPVTRTPAPPPNATVMGAGLDRKPPATPADGVPAATGVKFKAPAGGTAARPATASGLPRAPTPAPVRPSASSLPPATEPSKNAAQQYASGLSAAYSQEAPVTADLSAFDVAGLSLASLDGEDTGPAPGAFDLPAQEPVPMPASFGPPAAKPAAPPKPQPSSAPVDLFAPPEAAEAKELSFELSTDELEERAQKRASAPLEQPAPVTTPVLSPAMRRTPAAMAAVAPDAGPVTSAPPRELPRSHVIAGVVLAVLVAFLPVHFIAAMRERSAYAKIDREVVAAQAQADTPDAYAALDGYRAKQLDAKESAQRSIALTSLLLWGLLAGGLAYGYFRRLPWDRLLKRPA